MSPVREKPADELPDPLDPYPGNHLVRPLGPILTPKQTLDKLTWLPAMPRSLEGASALQRLHFLVRVRDLHIPPLSERQLYDSVDLMIRPSYGHRDPAQPSTWATLSGEAVTWNLVLPDAPCGIVEGLTGTGKTQACLRCLACYPLTYFHENFPGVVGGLTQVVSQSTQVPQSGTGGDLAQELMRDWASITRDNNRFEAWLSKDRITKAESPKALAEWAQAASSQFLGVLHLDEVQNFFKIGTLRQRKERHGRGEVPELSIVEDQTVRWLYVIMQKQIPLLISGTPDGVGALRKRLSAISKLLNIGAYHRLDNFSDPTSPTFLENFLQQGLGRYQVMDQRIELNKNFANLVVELTAGIQRVIIALWVAAHRVGLDRGGSCLTHDDFRQAARTWLGPLVPAVQALRSKNADAMAQYEDLVPRKTAFWDNFWADVIRV